MKKLVLLIVMMASGSLLFAQSEKYTTAMQKNIALIDSGLKKADMTDLANNFTRIAEVEKTQWLPYYYAAYCTVMNSYFVQDKSKADDIADKAEELINKAEAITGKPNSETHVIRSMIATAHMMVDPQTRWQQFGAASQENIQSAKDLDSTNPRPVLLEAQSKFYTPESFGGGKSVAKPLFEKAILMFDAFKPKTPLDPTWGRASAQYFLEQCK